MAALIKPLLEGEASEMRRTGILNDAKVLRDLLTDLCQHFLADEPAVLGLTYSPIRGNADTVAYSIELTFQGEAVKEAKETKEGQPLLKGDFSSQIDALVKTS